MREYDIKETYMELMESMERLVRSQKEAFLIIWFDIHDWLEPEHSAMKADLCGVLTEKVIGKNIAHEVHGPASDMSYYQEIQRKYAFPGAVFSIDGGKTWQASTIFEGLTPDTAYTIQAKYPGDRNHEAVVFRGVVENGRKLIIDRLDVGGRQPRRQ